MRYYLYKNELGEDCCIECVDKKYTDFLTGKEFNGDKSKLVAITPAEAQCICNQKVSKPMILDNDAVIVLIKPTEVAYTFHVLLSKLSENGLSINVYIPHIFTSEEVETLYGSLRKRSIADFDKNKSYLISGESAIAVICGKNARSIMEEKIGNKNSKEAKRGTIRSEIGSDTTCNGIEIVDDVPEKLSVIRPIVSDYTEKFNLGRPKTNKRAN